MCVTRFPKVICEARMQNCATAVVATDSTLIEVVIYSAKAVPDRMETRRICGSPPALGPVIPVFIEQMQNAEKMRTS